MTLEMIQEIIRARYAEMPENPAIEAIYKIYKKYGAPITKEIARAVCSYGLDEEIPEAQRLFVSDLLSVFDKGDGEYTQYQMDNRDFMTKKYNEAMAM